MKHIEPESQTKPVARTQTSKKRPMSAILATTVAALAIGGLGFGMTHWWNPLPVDHVSDKEKAELAVQFTHVRAIEIDQIKIQDIDAVMDSMRLDPTARLSMKKSLNSPSSGSSPTVLAQIVLWDFAAQDGDIVRVSSAGYEIDVPLMNAPTTVAIPVDASKTIKLSGTKDGGGGITLGIQSGNGKMSLPVITEGQVLSLPVSL